MGAKRIRAKARTGPLSTVALRLLFVLALVEGTAGKTLKYKVYEEQKVGTVIARLKEDVAGVLSKLPSSLTFLFRAMQRGGPRFLSVREEDGEISIATKIDREKLCEKNLNCSIEFDVVTLPTEYLQLFHVEVEVLDINDNSPHFSRGIVPIEISESASVGTRVPLDGAVDADVGENALHTGSSQAPLDPSLIVIISLVAVCTLLLIVMVMFATARCNREKKNPRHKYNCRVAESSYQNHPKKPSRQIHKADITLVPTINGTLPVRAHSRSPLPSPTPERGTLGSRQSHHSRQSLNSLVTISSNHVPENFALELAHATPPVEQVSQLLSMLHQGQYQPRPSFRGNKYTRRSRRTTRKTTLTLCSATFRASVATAGTSWWMPVSWWLRSTSSCRMCGRVKPLWLWLQRTQSSNLCAPAEINSEHQEQKHEK